MATCEQTLIWWVIRWWRSETVHSITKKWRNKTITSKATRCAPSQRIMRLIFYYFVFGACSDEHQFRFIYRSWIERQHPCATTNWRGIVIFYKSLNMLFDAFTFNILHSSSFDKEIQINVSSKNFFLIFIDCNEKWLYRQPNPRCEFFFFLCI